MGSIILSAFALLAITFCCGHLATAQKRRGEKSAERLIRVREANRLAEVPDIENSRTKTKEMSIDDYRWMWEQR